MHRLSINALASWWASWLHDNNRHLRFYGAEPISRDVMTDYGIAWVALDDGARWRCFRGGTEQN